MFKVDKINDLDNYILPFSFNALEPLIKGDTVQQHYEGHLLIYIERIKKLLIEFPVFQNLSLKDIILRSYGDFETTIVYYIASQIYSHILCFESLRPYNCSENSLMSNNLIDLIESSYTSIENFKQQFFTKAINLFGNGWLWIVLDVNNKIVIMTTMSAFNPLNLDSVAKVLACVDLWEHAYYLQFLHKRKEYLDNIWLLINWKYISEQLLV